MKHTIAISLCCLSLFAKGQNHYTLEQALDKQMFIHSSTGQETSMPLNNWDLAIEPEGDYAIRINEALGARAWTIPSQNYDNCSPMCRGLQDHQPEAIDTSGMRSETGGWVELHNSYDEWITGALNQEKPLVQQGLVNYGWGEYKGFHSDPMHAILGNRIFILKNRTGLFFQFFVRKSTSSGYECVVANIDGSDVKEITIKREGFANKMFAYLDLSTAQVIDLEPKLDTWNLLLSPYPANKKDGDASMNVGFLTHPFYTTTVFENQEPPCLTAGVENSSISSIGYQWQVSHEGDSVYRNNMPKAYAITDGTTTGLVYPQFYFTSNQSVSVAFLHQDANTEVQDMARDESCANCNNGEAQVNVSGSDCPYIIAWDHGPDTYFVDKLAPGIYHYDVIGNSGQVTRDSVLIEAFECQLEISAQNISPVSCNGGRDGSISVVGSGNGALSYNWSTGQNQANISNLIAGVYSVTITDEKGCEVEETFTLTEPNPLSIDFIKTPPSCTSCNDAQIQAVPQGGTEEYSYNWSNGANTALITGLSQGMYTLTLTDAMGCTLIDSVQTDSFFCKLSIESTSVLPLNCPGANNGKISVLAQGLGQLSFQLNDGPWQSTGLFSNLAGGTYTVKVKNAGGCIDSVTNIAVNEPPAFDLDMEILQAISCAGDNNASISLNVSGGSPSYSYSLNGGNFQSSPVFSELEAGTYTLEVMDIQNCNFQEEITIEEPLPLILAIQNYRQPTCGQANGQLILAATGGNPNYTYALNEGNWQSSAVFNNLEAGLYEVKVRDASMCITTEIFNLDSDGNLFFSSLNKSNPTCAQANDGRIIAEGDGNAPPFVYSIGEESNSTGIFENLAPGLYFVSITDQTGCTKQSSVDLIAPLALSFDFTFEVPSCSNGFEGSIQTTIEGGTPPYQVKVNGVTTSNYQSLEQLSSGKYTFEVVDAKACTHLQTVDLPQAEDLALEIVSNIPPHCAGESNGSLELEAAGGTPPYQYRLEGGMWQTAGQFLGLAAGEYLVEYADANQCIESQTVNVARRLPLSSTNTISPPTCNDQSNGQVVFAPQGGSGALQLYFQQQLVPNLSVQNLSPGTYDYFIVDGNQCRSDFVLTVPLADSNTFQVNTTQSIECFDASNGAIEVVCSNPQQLENYQFSLNQGPFQTDNTFIGLAAGYHDLAIADQKGCVQLFEVFLTAPEPLGVKNLDIDDLTCFGNQAGGISFKARGGTPPYQYALNDGTKQSHGIFLNLEEGDYQISIQDSLGCQWDSTVWVAEPEPLAITNFEITHDSCQLCNQGAIEIEVSGGSPPYRYEWDNGSTTARIENLSSGDYLVRVRDQPGCMTVGAYTIGILSLDEMKNADVKIFPNPSQGKVMVETSQPLQGLSIFNASGQLIERFNTIQNQFVLNLPKGLYIIESIDGNQVQKRFKIIIQ